jgi:hypothetical protein
MGRAATDGPHCPEPRHAVVESYANQLPLGITGNQRGGTGASDRSAMRLWGAWAS